MNMNHQDVEVVQSNNTYSRRNLHDGIRPGIGCTCHLNNPSALLPENFSIPEQTVNSEY